MDYFAYRLFLRPNKYSTFFCRRKLLQEFMVDGWATTEQSYLQYLRYNQRNLCADLYQGLVVVVTHQSIGHEERQYELNNLGCKILLLSSHIGSTRHMIEILQDSMAITRFYKHLDIFMIVTKNLRWAKI